VRQCGDDGEQRQALLGQLVLIPGRVLAVAAPLKDALGGAIAGAMLASQPTTAMHLRAVADAPFLPAAARPGFVEGFSRAARSGLQIGRGQAAAGPPDGTPAALLPELRHVIRDVFTHGYITAMHPRLAISVALLLAGAASCFLLRRHTGAATPAPPRAARTPRVARPPGPTASRRSR
jgi:hypothetical protein